MNLRHRSRRVWRDHPDILVVIAALCLMVLGPCSWVPKVDVTYSDDAFGSEVVGQCVVFGSGYDGATICLLIDDRKSYCAEMTGDWSLGASEPVMHVVPYLSYSREFFPFGGSIVGGRGTVIYGDSLTQLRFTVNGRPFDVDWPSEYHVALVDGSVSGTAHVEFRKKMPPFF